MATMERVLESPALTLETRSRREACLRPEHATRYPGLAAGQWESAATLADRVLAGALLRQDTTLRGRVLLDEHFEFRGGALRQVERARPRREDRR